MNWWLNKNVFFDWIQPSSNIVEVGKFWLKKKKKIWGKKWKPLNSLHAVACRIFSSFLLLFVLRSNWLPVDKLPRQSHPFLLRRTKMKDIFLRSNSSLYFCNFRLKGQILPLCWVQSDSDQNVFCEEHKRKCPWTTKRITLSEWKNYDHKPPWHQNELNRKGKLPEYDYLEQYTL